MNQPRSSVECFPLFPDEADIWESLDEPTREQVLDRLALLLLRHLEQTAWGTPENRPSPKESNDER